MKEFTEKHIDDIILLKYGQLVSDGNHVAYSSNAILGQIFKVSGNKIRQLILNRFEQIRRKSLPLQEQMHHIWQQN